MMFLSIYQLLMSKKKIKKKKEKKYIAKFINYINLKCILFFFFL